MTKDVMTSKDYVKVFFPYVFYLLISISVVMLGVRIYSLFIDDTSNVVNGKVTEKNIENNSDILSGEIDESVMTNDLKKQLEEEAKEITSKEITIENNTENVYTESISSAVLENEVEEVKKGWEKMENLNIKYIDTPEGIYSRELAKYDLNNKYQAKYLTYTCDYNANIIDSLIASNDEKTLSMMLNRCLIKNDLIKFCKMKENDAVHFLDTNKLNDVMFHVVSECDLQRE